MQKAQNFHAVCSINKRIKEAELNHETLYFSGLRSIILFGYSSSLFAFLYKSPCTTAIESVPFIGFYENFLFTPQKSNVRL